MRAWGHLSLSQVCRFGLVLLILGAALSPARSAPAPRKTPEKTPRKTFTVALLASEPFVMKQPNGQYVGFCIELWRVCAEQLGVESRYIEVSTVDELIHAVADQKADIGLGAVSITAERDKLIDYSQPMFDGGLGIAVPFSGSTLSTWQRATAVLWQPDMIHLPILFIILIIIPAHIVWLVERRHDHGIVSRAYFPGIFDACYWAASTLSTQAETMPKSPMGRLLAVAWMFCGILFTSYFTAVVTTAMTVVSLESGISGPSDLAGKRVATVSDTTAAAWLSSHSVIAVEEPSLQAAMQQLYDRRAQAVVFDEPTLLYYASHEGKGRVKIVGRTFTHENYGIVVPQGSPLRKTIDAALLTVSENGTYTLIYNRWFSSQ